jgi:hypothetical protein
VALELQLTGLELPGLLSFSFGGSVGLGRASYGEPGAAKQLFSFSFFFPFFPFSFFLKVALFKSYSACFLIFLWWWYRAWASWLRLAGCS